jgi:hypothetical protein
MKIIEWKESRSTGEINGMDKEPASEKSIGKEGIIKS